MEDSIEKKEYHEPTLREYGKMTDITLDASDDPLMFDWDINCHSW